jgi:hypothetical protein
MKRWPFGSPYSARFAPVVLSRSALAAERGDVVQMTNVGVTTLTTRRAGTSPSPERLTVAEFLGAHYFVSVASDTFSRDATSSSESPLSL